MSLLPALTHLETAGLIRLTQTAPTLSYVFRHMLQLEAAYHSLLKRERQHLHQVVGEVLEHTTETQAALLAYHFEHAHAYPQAFRYFKQAAAQAQALYANDEALTLYRAALTLSPHLTPAAQWQTALNEVQESLGDVLELTGQLAEAQAAYTAVLQATPEAERLTRARLWRKIGVVLGFQLQPPEAAAFDQAEQLLGAAPAGPDPTWWQEWLQLQLTRMEMYYRQGQWQAIIPLVAQTRPLLARYGTPAMRMLFYDGLISIAERRERYVMTPEIVADTRAMLAAATESGLPRHLVAGRFQLGFCLLWCGEWAQSETELLAAAELAERIGFAVYHAYILTYIALLYRRQGLLAQARPWIAAAHAATTAQKIWPHLAVAEGNWAWLHWRAGEWDAAYAHGQTALGHLQNSMFAYPFQWAVYLPLLAVATTRGQVSEAVQYATQLLDVTQQLLPDPLNALLAEAVAHHRQGANAQARASLQAAVRAAESLNYL